MLTNNFAGGALYYEVHGTGETVVLCASASSSSVQFKQSGLAEALAQRFQVVLYDYTGLGQSGRVPSVTKSQWVEDVISVLDAVGVDRAHVGGSSLGSRVAGRVALDYPERVKSLFVDNPITVVGAESEAALNRGFLPANLAGSPRAEAFEAMHGEDWMEAVRFYGQARLDPALQQHLTLRDHIPNIQAPTLVMHSDVEDTVHPLANAFEWHTKARDSWLWVAPGTSTTGLINQLVPQFIEVFSAFISRKKA
jgi:pimeloyl-ACP methyl ester carboxylesterase